MTTPLGGGTADLVAELRAQAEAAVARAAETKEQVAREVVEVREQARAVAAALEAGARQSAETIISDGEQSDAAALADARAAAASAIAEAEAQAASIRVTAAEAADDAAAALARAEVRRESAAVQADALRATARREAALHRRQQLDEIHQTAHGHLDATSDVVSGLCVALDDLSTTLSGIPSTNAGLRADLDSSSRAGTDPAPEASAAPDADTTGTDPANGVPPRHFGRPGGAADRLRRVRNR
ncbi:hypothetical protein [Nocardioides bizhenqiangii]|uniref:Uncharacterized protein n=1 Tax=Nocardioides bizhenqiangii TaxID=3095076 RepID=A0ABZ0ZLV3_9ACTN|nr:MULTISPECIES: hypothetical protein [unclassified Nocardioides]MDZ5620309.1 hypothetical protein [Nocardioides sp. HM23]WQQ24683.1 hypothetical protein SHK19_11955 [Nocardioides sp. HM61]